MTKEEKPKRRRVISFEQCKRSPLCVAKPSYLLSLGSRSTRNEYLNDLPKILRELLRQRNLNRARSVLSVLMQGTIIYESQIQILSHFHPNKNKAKDIGNIYDTWIGKIGKQHKEERLLVWFEQICHFIEYGMNNDAYSGVISMMQNRDFGMLPHTNPFIGISLYKLWRCKFLKELQLEDEDCESISNTSVSRSDNRLTYPVRDDSFYFVGSHRNESEASVVNYKRENSEENEASLQDSRTRMDMNVNMESRKHFTNSSQHYSNSGEKEVSLQDGVARTFDPTVIKIIGDMDPWLLPLKPPEDPDCYRKIVNDSYYKEAVKYMRLTVQSPPHVSLGALHPYVQLLLIRGHVDEAMKVVEEMCNKVHVVKPFRIKAFMMERFHSNSGTLAKCYEDVLNIDPSCVTTLKKLIVMSNEDGYSKESLIEIIAMHVETSFPEPEIWEEFASCFRYFFENLDEDRLSVCLNGYGKNPNQHQTYYVTPVIQKK